MHHPAKEITGPKRYKKLKAIGKGHFSIVYVNISFPLFPHVELIRKLSWLLISSKWAPTPDTLLLKSLTTQEIIS